VEFNPYAPPTRGAEQGAAPLHPPGELAGLGHRVAAKLLDILLVAIAAAPGIVLVEAFGIRDAAILIFALPSLLMIVQWWLIAARGQTLGKRWLGIRIVTQKGEPVGFVRGVLLREWVMKAGGTLVYGMPLLVDPLFALGPRRMCLHDHLADTKVVLATAAGR
jgi:uncharacterized RDD family membrane protein YckC